MNNENIENNKINILANGILKIIIKYNSLYSITDTNTKYHLLKIREMLLQMPDDIVMMLYKKYCKKIISDDKLFIMYTKYLINTNCY